MSNPLVVVFAAGALPPNGVNKTCISLPNLNFSALILLPIGPRGTSPDEGSLHFLRLLSGIVYQVFSSRLSKVPICIRILPQIISTAALQFLVLLHSMEKTQRPGKPTAVVLHAKYEPVLRLEPSEFIVNYIEQGIVATRLRFSCGISTSSPVSVYSHVISYLVLR